MDRRDFLRVAGGSLFAAGVTGYGISLMIPYKMRVSRTASTLSQRRWGMLIDLNRCRKGCHECMKACREENNTARFGDKRWDIHWIRKVTVKRRRPEGAEEKEVPILCNHCDHPPCAQVCPVQATYKREDGVVIVDHHRCIGCRYCMIACPYSVRFFNYRENPDWPNKDRPRRSHGVAEGCTLCVHRLDLHVKTGRSPEPACAQRCREIGAGAITVGDLNDPDDPISVLIREKGASRLREDLGTEPKVFYLGL